MRYLWWSSRKTYLKHYGACSGEHLETGQFLSFKRKYEDKEKLRYAPWHFWESQWGINWLFYLSLNIRMLALLWCTLSILGVTCLVFSFWTILAASDSEQGNNAHTYMHKHRLAACGSQDSEMCCGQWHRCYHMLPSLCWRKHKQIFQKFRIHPGENSNCILLQIDTQELSA